MQRYNQAIEKFAPKATRKVNPGDVFCIKLRDLYYWGRVIKTDSKEVIGLPSFITYLYKHPTLDFSFPSNRYWSYSNLLLKPFHSGKIWWSSKYAYNVGVNIPITREEANRTHYYLKLGENSCVVDDYGNKQPFKSISKSQAVGESSSPNRLHIAYDIDEAEGRDEFFNNYNRAEQATGRELRFKALEPYYKD